MTPQRRYYLKNKDRWKEYQRSWARKDPRKYMWVNARARARQRGLEFTIELDDIVIPAICPVLGTPLVFVAERSKNGQARPDAPSLDRINSKAGYVKGNVQVISWRANNLKGDASLDELERLVQWLREQ